MSLKSRFLSLSMREQICLAILFLHIFCLLSILAIFCSLAYQILMENYKQKKLYFFDKYKEYLESCYNYHNYCLLEYEELIRRFQKQAWKYHQSLNTYVNEINDFDDYSDDIVIYKDEIHKNIISEKSSDNSSKLFLFCFYRNENNKELEEGILKQIYNNIKANYQALSNAIMSHDIGEFFNIPYFNEPIMKSPLFINIKYFTLMSFNATNIHEKILEIQKGDISNLNYSLFPSYYSKKVQEFLSGMFNIFNFFFDEKLGLELFQLIYNKAYSEIIKSIDLSGNLNSQENYYYFASKSSGYFSSIDIIMINFLF